MIRWLTDPPEHRATEVIIGTLIGGGIGLVCGLVFYLIGMHP